MNENCEIRVGNKIYKQVSRHVEAVIANADLTVLNKVRELGILAYDPFLSFYDEYSGESLPSKPPVTPNTPESCAATIDYNIDINPDGDDIRKVKLKAVVFAPYPTLVCGLVNFKVTWGDGFSTNYSSLETSPTHTYNENLAIGACKTFMIKIEATLANTCGEYPTGTKVTESKTIAICNGLIGCTEMNFSRNTSPNNNFVFMYNGSRFLIHGEIGQSNFSNLFNDKKLWATTSFYKSSNGEYKSSVPPNNLGASLYGWYITNNCTTKSVYWEGATWKKKKSVTHKKKPGEKFGTLKTGETVWGHFMANMDNSTPYPAIYSFPLWP